MKVSGVDNNIAVIPYRPAFQANIKPAEFGRLQQGTINRVRNLLNIYNEIQSKLSCITEKGIECLNNNRDLNVVIGEGIGFKKCGDKGNYIMLRGATTDMYKDLMRIIVRKSDSIDGNKHMIDSFMLYWDDRAVTNFDPNRSKQFPNECILATEKELKATNYDERLQKTINMLEMPVLRLRQALNKIPPEHLRKPDGILEYKFQATLREIGRLNKETEALEKSLSHSTLYRYKSGNCPTYMLSSGLKSFSFKDLGPNKLTIQCADVESTAEEPFKRLVVSDSHGKSIATYIINNNKKIVKNRSLTNFHYDSKSNSKPVYLDSDEIKDKEFLDKLQKYLNLYINELMIYNQNLKAFVDSFKATKTAGELPNDISNNLEMCAKYAEELFKNKNFHSEKLLVPLVEKGVATVTGRMRSGITFTDYVGNRNVQFKPINTKKHEKLYKLTVCDDKGILKRCYLIKDFKYVVSNYNPYTQQVPDVLQLYDDKEIETIEIEGVTDYLVNKFKEIKEIIDNADTYKECRIRKTDEHPVKERKQKWGRISREKLNKPIEQLFEDGRKELRELPPKSQMPPAKELADHGDYQNVLSSWRRCFYMAVNSANKSDLEGIEVNIKKLYEKMKDYLINNKQ